MGKLMSQKEAGKLLEISVRQARRLVKLYRVEGMSGLINKQRGRPSNRRLDKAGSALAMQQVGEHYRDFGPTLTSEKLSERQPSGLSSILFS